MTTEGTRQLVARLALADGFQFIIGACDSPEALYGALGELVKQAGARRGEPVLPVLLDPYIAQPFDRPMSAYTFTNQVLSPILGGDFSDPTHYPLVVIDASRADSAVERAGSRAGWLSAFQRMNEQRNAIVRALPGTLLLTLPDGMVPEFANRAADFWSIRSTVAPLSAGAPASEALGQLLDHTRGLEGMGGEAERQASLRLALAQEMLDDTPPAPEPLQALARLVDERYPALADELRTHLRRPLPDWWPNSLRRLALYLLLQAMFSPTELRRWLMFLSLDGLEEIDWFDTPARTVWRVVRRLEQQGVLDDAFFDRLLHARPHRGEEIELLRRQWGGSGSLSPRGSSLEPIRDDGELFRVLSRLGLGQIRWLSAELGLHEEVPVSWTSVTQLAELLVQIVSQRNLYPEVTSAVARVAPDALRRSG